MADKNKDVIYIDIDDEITSVIDKVRNSDGKILALVLPKRASVFQSIVNMKLLKRSADEAKKRLVLITSEAGLLPLAGAVGIHVAKSLQSKPEIPAAPDSGDTEYSIDEDEPLTDPDELTAETAGDRPIGELAGPAAAVPLATDDAMETVELDNEDEDAEAASKAVSAAPLPLAVKKDKKLKVPNFDRFRLWLVLGVLALIALIVFAYFAVAVMPKATIAVKTNATNVNTKLDLILDSDAKSFDPAANVVPAKQVQQQKTYTQTAAATGQQNKGDRAKGQVKIINCSSGDPLTIPAGTGVSSGGMTYITQQAANMPVGSKTCKDFAGTTSDTVDVVAQSPGTKYNVASGTTFTVAGYSTVTNASADSAIEGGTDNIVKVVSQADIDGAKAKVDTKDNTVKQDLKEQLQQSDYYAVVATFHAGDPATTTSANAGDAAENVTVTSVVTYTMLGAKENDLKGLIDSQIKDQIDTSKQSILDDGLSSAEIKVTGTPDKTAQLSLQATGVVGPDINTDAIKQLAAGKKSGEIKAALKSEPGITDVSVKLSPFWVTSVPKKTPKITVTIAKPTTTIKSDATNP